MINFDNVTKENITKQNSNWPKIYLYARDPYIAKYQFSIDKTRSPGLEHLNYSEVFIEYSNDMDDIYKILKNTLQIRNEKI